MGLHRIERRACAKINLNLRITGVRGDGYHELATVFQTVSMFDVLQFESVEPDAPLTLACSDPAVPVDDRNLVWKAAVAVWRAAGREAVPRGVRVTVLKGIPTQAGLGGGSADVAVALRAFAEIWHVSLAEHVLSEIASTLGADVPFFLCGGTASGSGRGDRIQAWPDVPSLEIVIACPSFGVATADAYRWYDESSGPAVRSQAGPAAAAPSHSRALAVSDFYAWLSSCRNDFEPVVFARHPRLGEIRERLRCAGALQAQMCGSGSAVYGVFPDAAAADLPVAAVTDLGVRVHRARTVSRAEYVVHAWGGSPPVGLPPVSAIV
jgi:4-diphosphocytidyl-2-C-methyl-D-erythritol kinase